MPDKIKILLADDHQLIIEGILSYLKDIDNLEIVTTNSCDDAYAKIKVALVDEPFQILFTDLSFDNVDATCKIDSGENLLKTIIREKIPIKFGVITGHS